MELSKDKSFKIKISLIPFILLLTIGLIEGNQTVYQKVFKTYMIFIFDIELLILFALYVFTKKINLKYVLMLITAVTFGIIQNFIFYMSANFFINLFILSVVTVVSFYLFSVNINEKKHGAYEKEKKYVLFFILYLVYIFIQYAVSFFSGEVSYDRNYHFSNYIMLLIFALFFYLMIEDLEEIKTGLLFINAFIVIVMIWSTSEFIQLAVSTYKSNSLTFNIGSIISQFRPKLSFGNTDYFSGYMVGILPLVFAAPFIFYQGRGKSRKNILTIITAVIAFLGLVPLIFSQTVAALIGLFIGTIIIFIPSVIFMQEKMKLRNKLIVFSIIIGVLALIACVLLFIPNPVSKNILPRLLAKFSNPLFALNDRFNAWSCGLSLFNNHPVLGSGLGTFYASSFKYMNKFFYIYSDSNSFKHAHNEFVEVLGEGGIVGIALFIMLFGFVIVMMFRRAYSKKYDFSYRMICLGTAIGIISMMIHQLFSLSLRMSVTMTMYFFLLGLGVFLISYSRKGLLVNEEISGEEEKKLFNGTLTKKNLAVLSVVIFIMLAVSLALFLPLYLCENNIVKALPLTLEKPIKDTDYRLNNAIKYMPGNPYAWTYKFTFDSENKLYAAFNDSSARSYEEYYDKIEKIFGEIFHDLDRIDSIIPGYQDVWSKYGQAYFIYYRYMEDKFGKTGNMGDLERSKQHLESSLFYFNKSIDMNFLDRNSHLHKLFLLKKLDNKIQFSEALSNYITARIYLDFARNRKIVKENIKIQFSDTDPTSLKVEKNRYDFMVSKGDVNLILERDYLIEEYDNMANTINEDVTNFFTAFKNDKLSEPEKTDKDNKTQSEER